MSSETRTDTITLEELFPPAYDGETDLSLMSAMEWETWVRYLEVRRFLKELYPNPRFSPNLDPSLQLESDIDIPRARTDPKAPLYLTLLFSIKQVFDKIHVLQANASIFEKYVIRWYWCLVHNWQTLSKQLGNTDVYEVTEAYFKIMRKYSLPVFEDPYYFLTAQRKRNMHYDVQMLKRTTACDINEMHVSILEAFL